MYLYVILTHILYIYSENEKDQMKKYWLVMEYADGDTLGNYLKKNLYKLTWHNKYNLAYQLACAVSCLHEEGVLHRDLVISILLKLLLSNVKTFTILNPLFN